jgi:hypothetical protein
MFQRTLLLVLAVSVTCPVLHVSAALPASQVHGEYIHRRVLRQSNGPMNSRLRFDGLGVAGATMTDLLVSINNLAQGAQA